MRKPTLTIFYQFNPWDRSIGGIQTVIRYFIKYAPSEFIVRLVGTETNPDRPLGQWYEAELAGRELQFFPLFWLKDDNIRRLFPTSVRYTAALLGKDLASDFMHFHRLEPTVATLHWSGEKTLFVHNDIHQQIKAKNAADGILWKRFPAVYFAFERLLIPQFDQILSCNSESTVLYRQHYPNIAQRISFVRNTFDGELFYPVSLAERQIQRQQLADRMGLSSETQFILFAGRLHPQKDPLLLLQAMAAIDQPTAHLLVAGEGELGQSMQEQIVALGLTDRVTLLGSLDQNELADLHRLSSAFVLTSAYEGLPLVVLEALACGTPIVTTLAGETPRLLSSSSGIVCPDRSPKTIATALRQILRHPEHYPSSACIRDAQPYSAQMVVREVYDQMLQRWERRNLVASIP